MATSTTPATGFLVHRPVRAYPRPLPAIELTVAAPPTIGWTASSLAGWLQYLVPLVGSGGSVAFLFAIPGPRPAWLIALVAGAAVASVVAGLALRLLERRSARRARRRERSRYLAHLEQIAIQVNQLAAAQLAVAEHLHPDLPTLWATIDQTNRLWERRPGDADFLAARVGRGPIPLATPARLDTAGGPLAEYDPDLLEAAKDLVRRANWLPDAPVAIPLRQLPILSLTGPPARTRALARSLVCQLAAFHAPDDLQILAAHPPSARPTWDWLRSLPHTRDPTARDPTAALGQPPASLLADTRTRSGDARPHLLAILDTTRAGPVADPPRGLDSTERPGRAVRDTRVEQWLERAAAGGVAAAGIAGSGVAAPGVTVVWVAATTADEPSELSMRIRVDDQGFATLLETVPSGRQVTGIRADSASIATCETIARRLAPLRLDRPLPMASRTGPIRLLDLLASQARSSGSAGDTGPAGREAQPGQSDPAGKASPDGAVGPHGDELPLRPRGELLNVPVGVGLAGEPLVLDLKEAAEGGIGPHGLVVGATGSGKSELLRTIVAGLAATHPPEQLAFVLVDFKGGAAFAPSPRSPRGRGSSPTCNPTSRWSTAPWPPSRASWPGASGSCTWPATSPTCAPTPHAARPTRCPTCSSSSTSSASCWPSGPSSWTSSPPSAGSVAAWACISCSPPSASTKAACAASTATSGSGSASAPSAPPSPPRSSASPTPTTSPRPPAQP
jgi:S-DNA-T family DNA segregation ATPase FtsK/SpoIIIE